VAADQRGRDAHTQRRVTTRGLSAMMEIKLQPSFQHTDQVNRHTL
jgi:hypothetical protein